MSVFPTPPRGAQGSAPARPTTKERTIRAFALSRFVPARIIRASLVAALVFERMTRPC